MMTPVLWAQLQAQTQVLGLPSLCSASSSRWFIHGNIISANFLLSLRWRTLLLTHSCFKESVFLSFPFAGFELLSCFSYKLTKEKSVF